MSNENTPRFDLAQAGVVVTSSPLHGDPGQMTNGQNVEFKRLQGLGGIGSRAPITAFTKTVMAGGNVLAAIAVPLPSPIDNLTLPTVWLFTSTGYLTSTDGSTFTAVALGVVPSGVAALFDATSGQFAYTSTYNTGTKTTTVKLPKGTAQVPGYVTGLALHPNGKYYVAVLTTGVAFTGIQNAGGWNGGSWNATTETPTNAVTGEVLEIDATGVILRQMGESFGLNNAGIDLGTSTVPPRTTFKGQDGRINHDNNGRGPIGGAPGGIAISATGRLYVTFGDYYLNAPSGAGLDVYNGIDYLSMDPDTDTTWTARVSNSVIGQSFTRFDNANKITSGPGPILPDAFSADTPWFAGFSPDPSTVSSSLGVSTGDHQGSCVFSNGLSSNLKLFPDPNGASISGIAFWTGIIKFGSKIFVAYYDQTSPTSSPNHIRVYVATSDDASTLSLDHDVLTSVSPAPPSTHVIPGQPYLFDPGGGQCLFWPFAGVSGHETEGFVLKRTSGGTWTVAVSGLSNLVGPAFSATVAI